eukprot:Nk52_evm2s292 gene=Nk52_evmTU2s292
MSYRDKVSSRRWCVEGPFDAVGVSDFEVSIHECPKRMMREMKQLFPCLGTETEKDKALVEELLIVPTFQRMESDMLGVENPGADKEKDEKLDVFFKWATAVCQKIVSQSYFADFTDPCSGFPAIGERGTTFYPDVNGAEALLGYNLDNMGCCKVLSHPKWGTKVYPATLFTTAPAHLLKEAIIGYGGGDEAKEAAKDV